ncbi:2-hydroxyacid dehydrogenase [Devosia naphthalenivorans]|uniref:2-hydroxyacid dehydrogenase n=1 Tax=Devosia naphthalenivorans TaxID=2082392 RepID=UPI000D3C4C89|nr:2-hydroxyacid dehydrogenase [Devosia naphthalenivorans]
MTKPLIYLPKPLPPAVTDPLEQKFELFRAWQAGASEQHSPAIKERVQGIVTLGGRVDQALMSRFPRLEIVANYGVGYDIVDAAGAAERSIMVTNTPDVLNDEVADTAIGLLLMTIRNLGEAERYLRAGGWESAPFRLSPVSMRGRKVGLVGLGRIGTGIAERLVPFGVEIAYHSRSPRPEHPFQHFPDLVAMARHVNILIVIVPGGEQTRHLINAEVLDALGTTGIVINVARGSVIDEQALITALKSGIILGAGLDVFENEPYVPADLLEMDHVVLLPHVGSASVPTRNAMSQLVADNVITWFDTGKALTPVSETAHIVRRTGPVHKD